MGTLTALSEDRLVGAESSADISVTVGQWRGVATEIAARRIKRLLVLVSPGRRSSLASLEACDASLTVQYVSVSHVPVEEVERARRAALACEAEWIMAVGGGAVIGVAKGVARRVGLPICAVPTTYSGSEQTEIWGETDLTGKLTGRDARCRPRWVVYDPSLQRGLPESTARASLLNALAHSVEALWSTDVSERGLQAADKSLGLLWRAMNAYTASPSIEVLIDACWGAALAGLALDQAVMGLQHQLAHVVGGVCKTPHAETHAVLLPVVLGFKGASRPDVLARLSSTWNTEDPVGLLAHQMRAWGLPVSLAALGVEERALDQLATAAASRPYLHGEKLSCEAYLKLLKKAWTPS